MKESREAEKLQSEAVSAAIFFSLIIFLVTLFTGIISDSITLLLDASAEFIIVFMSFVLRSSIKKVHLPADRFYNFGCEKYEPLTVVLQAAMIMLTCVIASYFAIQDIAHPDDTVRYDIPMYVSFFVGITSVLNAAYLKRAALKTGSHMLRASSVHWFVDSALAFAMCLGFAFGFFLRQAGYYRITPYVDPVMALLLAAVFFWTPLKLMRKGLRQLLDAAPARDVREEIEKIIEKYKASSFGIQSIRMRRAGEKVFLDACFLVHGDTTMAQAQQFAQRVEKDVAERFPRYDIIVYFYPAQQANNHSSGRRFFSGGVNLID